MGRRCLGKSNEPGRGDAPRRYRIIELGGQPDSIAISSDGRYAAIAIENERDEDVNEGAMPQPPAGFLTIVDLVGQPQNWSLRNVSLTGLAERFPEDPEPEFVDINARNEAVVTLQENNHIVIVDLSSGEILRHFSAGSVTHAVDLENDGVIAFDDLLINSRREPDAVHWTPEGYLFTVNEGDYDLDTDFVGGRGFTQFTASGDVQFDSGAGLEIELAAAGLYNDARSGAKGSEPEGIEISKFGNRTFLFVGIGTCRAGCGGGLSAQWGSRTPHPRPDPRDRTSPGRFAGHSAARPVRSAAMKVTGQSRSFAARRN